MKYTNLTAKEAKHLCRALAPLALFVCFAISSLLAGCASGSSDPMTLPAAGKIATVAGNGFGAYSGDGGSATAAEICHPYGVALDSKGNVIVVDTLDNRIREVDASSGVISTVAGDGPLSNGKYTGDGGPATSAGLYWPAGAAADSSGNIYIADTYNNAIRKVTTSTGTISTVAGTGTAGYSGDGGDATKAKINTPFGVALDAAGDIYIADYANNVIRMVAASTANGYTAGSIYTVAGGAATDAQLNSPISVTVDGANNLYIADTGNNLVRMVASTTANGYTAGNIYAVAGGGSGCSEQTDAVGDGCPATAANLDAPWGLAVDGSGNLFIGDSNDQRVRMVAASTANGYTAGDIYTVAGDGYNGSSTAGGGGYSGDDGPAIQAELNIPTSLAINSSGDLFVADTFNNVIRVVNTNAGTQ